MSSVRLAVAALVLAAVFVLPATAAAPAPASRGITIVSSGVVRVKPNSARLSVSVVSHALTARAALSRNSSRTAKVIAALKKAGVVPADLQTSFISLTRGTTKRDRRFRVENSVRVTVRGVTRIARVLDAAIAAGANRLEGPELFLANADQVYARALDKALDKAREKARRMAAAADARIGRVVSIVEAGTFVPGQTNPGNEVGFGSPVLIADAPVEPGLEGIRASVTMTFALN